MKTAYEGLSGLDEIRRRNEIRALATAYPDSVASRIATEIEKIMRDEGASRSDAYLLLQKRQPELFDRAPDWSKP